MAANFRGVPVTQQIAIGRVKKLDLRPVLPASHTIGDGWAEVEAKAWRIARRAAREQLKCVVRCQKNRAVTDVLRVHLMMVDDPELDGQVLDNIEKRQMNVQAALDTAANFYLERIGAGGERFRYATDLRDVRNRLLRILKGAPDESLEDFKEPVVVVARELSTSQAAAMNRERVLGFATDAGTAQGHAAEIALRAGLPAVVGCNGLYDKARDGDILVVDGEGGLAVLAPGATQRENYERRRRELALRQKKQAWLLHQPAHTSDGQRVSLLANVHNLDAIDRLGHVKVDGIGVLGTEALYQQHGVLPDEETQFRFYRRIAKRMEGRPAAIRTFSTVPAPGHAAPVRMGPEHTGALKTQLRAILRASVHGCLRILFPMIVSLEEQATCRQLLEECRNELDAGWVSYDRSIQAGVLVETPSAVILAGELARQADFFYVAIDELAQYMLAEAPSPTREPGQYSCCHPTVLRSIQWVVQSGAPSGCWVGVSGSFSGGCGNDCTIAPLLLGMGVREISADVAALAQCKQAIARCTVEASRQLATQVLALDSRTEVEHRLTSPAN